VIAVRAHPKGARSDVSDPPRGLDRATKAIRFVLFVEIRFVHCVSFFADLSRRTGQFCHISFPSITFPHSRKLILRFSFLLQDGEDITDKNEMIWGERLPLASDSGTLVLQHPDESERPASRNPVGTQESTPLGPHGRLPGRW
jgi:hypothetical protein